jgi:heterotetrameric sarcosine oxidase gamma subunit
VSAPEPACPFGSALPAGRYGAPGNSPVQISARRYELVQLSTRRGQSDSLAGAIRARFSLNLPPPGRAATAGDLAALWLQPEAWLLTAPPGEPRALARSVKDACGEAGSVVDQTQGRAVLRLSGAHAGEVLARICRLDLHPRTFRPGCVAVTPVAELSCVLYQPQESPSARGRIEPRSGSIGEEARLTFELIVPASYAGWFAEAVLHAASGTGAFIEGAGAPNS